ncbi:MAG: hypothetical protein P4M13_05310 [Alphaproteobacteria bacterium]|nr:hypothetical protein [Alphaproteobacteria bacterium]
MTTPQTGLKALKRIMESFDSLDAYLQAAHEILEDGHMPDMADMDDRVAHLCSCVQEAAPEIQERCLAKLDALLKKIDMCEEEIIEFQTKSAKSGKQ